MEVILIILGIWVAISGFAYSTDIRRVKFENYLESIQVELDRKCAEDWAACGLTNQAKIDNFKSKEAFNKTWGKFWDYDFERFVIIKVSTS